MPEVGGVGGKISQGRAWFFLCSGGVVCGSAPLNNGSHTYRQYTEEYLRWVIPGGRDPVSMVTHAMKAFTNIESLCAMPLPSLPPARAMVPPRQPPLLPFQA